MFTAKHCDDEREFTHIRKNSGIVNRFGFFITKTNMFEHIDSDYDIGSGSWFRKKLPQTQMIEFYGSSETSRLNNRRQSMDLTVEEKNEIEIRLVEIQTILENSLYEDSDEERELLREQNELEHMLEIQNYVR